MLLQKILRALFGKWVVVLTHREYNALIKDYEYKRDFERMVLEKLFQILHESGDYEGIRKVAEKGMLIEPDKPELYYWLMVAYEKMNMPHTVWEYLRTAQERLSKGEYNRLVKWLEDERTM